MCRRRSLTDQVHDRLRHMIVSLHLQPRQPLVEKELCKSFGVSRTPLREAILRLAEHGLITVAPQHGTFVSGISPRSVRWAHVLRESLEVPVMQRLASQPARRLDAVRKILLEQKILAARNDQAGFILLDDQFHEALFAACGVADLWGVIHAEQGHLDRVRFIQGNLRGGVTLPLAQDEALVDALAEGAAHKAAALTRAHVAGSWSSWSATCASVLLFLRAGGCDSPTSTTRGACSTFAAIHGRLGYRSPFVRARSAERPVPCALAPTRDHVVAKPTFSVNLRNNLFHTMPIADRSLITPHLQNVDLEQGAVLEESGEPIANVFFPLEGIGSMLAIEESGRRIEAGLFGRDGMSGTSVVMGVGATPNRTVMQVRGHGLMIAAERLRELLDRSPSLQRHLLLYVQ